MYTRLFEIYIRPIISYGFSVYGSSSAASVDLLEKVSLYYEVHYAIMDENL